MPDGYAQRERDVEMARGATDWSWAAIAWLYEHDAEVVVECWWLLNAQFGERYSDSAAAKDRAAWRIVTVARHKEEGPAKRVIATWVRNGLLKVEHYDSPGQRKPVSGLIVDNMQAAGLTDCVPALSTSA
jgi:hypothetical protein